jgi:hypothetical protein
VFSQADLNWKCHPVTSGIPENTDRWPGQQRFWVLRF